MHYRFNPDALAYINTPWYSAKNNHFLTIEDSFFGLQSTLKRKSNETDETSRKRFHPLDHEWDSLCLTRLIYRDCPDIYLHTNYPREHLDTLDIPNTYLASLTT